MFSFYSYNSYNFLRYVRTNSSYVNDDGGGGYWRLEEKVENIVQKI